MTKPGSLKLEGVTKEKEEAEPLLARVKESLIKNFSEMIARIILTKRPSKSFLTITASEKISG